MTDQPPDPLAAALDMILEVAIPPEIHGSIAPDGTRLDRDIKERNRIRAKAAILQAVAVQRVEWERLAEIRILEKTQEVGFFLYKKQYTDDKIDSLSATEALGVATNRVLEELQAPTDKEPQP